MGKINKHTFEAVSLLTLNKGQIEVTVIPAQDQPDWIVPSNLILEVVEYTDRIWTYIWQDCDVAVYHLLEKDTPPTKLVILEGSNDIYRLALQTQGELTHRQVGISQVKDLSAIDIDEYSIVNNDYIFQKVQIEDDEYIVPDLEELAHRLVDLDG
ncbi:hypothetical protein [Psychrobacter sp. I-STPA10]|uniref:hypothetical protein n=1 Tax=Psychrobacter sp. I-STPA10 TaxID=2585769 RepID=UPI001E311B39|nr:hypothetical protein [Psychrobacter sp. I-STPA10]